MTSDLDLQDKEDEYEEARARAICLDAAILVVQGQDRASAVEEATETFETQQEADNDPTGTIATLDEAQSPKIPKGKEAQVHAIAQELYDEHF